MPSRVENLRVCFCTENAPKNHPQVGLQVFEQSDFVELNKIKTNFGVLSTSQGAVQRHPKLRLPSELILESRCNPAYRFPYKAKFKINAVKQLIFEVFVPDLRWAK